MIAEIITIGLEVTTGSILNTNSKYIASKLLELGIDAHYHTSVDDNGNRLKNVISVALERADIIITTGGLGPTNDDVTKEIIAEYLGLELINDRSMEEQIKRKFDVKEESMPASNLKQASLPKGSKFLNNSIGTAPGIFIELDGKKIIMLPGPPKEMKPMFNDKVIPLIREDFNIINKSINLVGIGESELESKIRDLISENQDLTVATFVKDTGIEIKIIGKGKDYDSVKAKVDNTIQVLSNRFKEYIYGYDNTSLEESIFLRLKEKNYKIGFCESCTGGLVSSRFSSIPGVSSVFDRAIVTYSNTSKMEELGVSKETLEIYGAVSSQTAIEMAEGLLNKANLDITVSITGIAGPDGGTKDKPVGTVYICICSKLNSIVKKFNFTGSRQDIQSKSATAVFIELRKFLI